MVTASVCRGKWHVRKLVTLGDSSSSPEKLFEEWPLLVGGKDVVRHLL
jgi:hypothetical protein